MSRFDPSSPFMRKDGPFSWIILATIIVNGFSGLGWLFGSIGVFADVFPGLLGIEAAKANSLGSSFIGVCMCSVPFNTLFITLAGCRIVSGFGGSLILISILASAFGTQLWHLLISYSLIGGIGVSMNIASSVAIIPHYFERRKPLAYSCLGLGEGIALVALPYILKYLLDTYEYRSTLLYISPISLLTLVGPIVFIPQQQSKEGSIQEKALVKSYFGSLKKFATPFYLSHSFMWQGGLGGAIVLGFQYLVKVSDVSVALLCYSIMGAAYLGGSMALVGYLLKYKVNHYIVQIILSAALGTTIIILTFMRWQEGYYACFVVFGILYGLIISNMPCVSAHLYQGEDVEYSYGFMQVLGGIGSTAVPIVAGILQEKYGLNSGMYFLGGLLILGALSLIVPALIKPKLWRPIDAETDSAIGHKDQDEKSISDFPDEDEHKIDLA